MTKQTNLNVESWKAIFRIFVGRGWKIKTTAVHFLKPLVGIRVWSRKTPRKPSKFEFKALLHRGYTRGERRRRANVPRVCGSWCKFGLMRASRHSYTKTFSIHFWVPAASAKAWNATHAPPQ